MLHWWLLLEEYILIIKYIKGPDNDSVDALNTIPLIKSDVTESKIKMETLADSYCVDKLDISTLPLTYQIIWRYQQKEKWLVAKPKQENYHTQYFCGGGILTLWIFRSDEIVIPKILQNYAVNWYHAYLLHPGIYCTGSTISQNNYWPNIRDNIRTNIKDFNTCQINKKKA